MFHRITVSRIVTHSMKTFFKYLAILLVLFIGFNYVKESFREYGIVNVSNSKLCIPKSYELIVNVPYLWFIDDEDLDENAAGGLYKISAQEVADSITGYTYSHINQYNVDLKHEITGIIWGLNQIGKPNGVAEAAWNVQTEKTEPAVDFNESLNLYEIGDRRFIDTWWSLAKTPPNPRLDAMPDDWFIGSCIGKKPMNFRCKRSFIYKDFYFTYDVQAHDLHLIPQIESFLQVKFEEWESYCKA